ncbi:MAG: sensor histidine kinase [Roseburia sp.]
MTIPQFFSHATLDQILAGGNLRIPFSFLYISLIAVFVFLSINIFNRKMYLTLLQKVTYTILSILGIGIAHYILLLTLKFSQNAALAEETNILILINLSFLAMFLALLIYISQLGQSKEQNIKYLELEKQHELEEQQYRILLNTTESLHEMKHDTKHHMDVIKTLAEQNELQKLQDYVTAYDDFLEKGHYLLSTGNTAIDCIMSSKLALAKQNHIAFDYSIMTPHPFPIDDILLSSLLGNILDNAIEGCVRSKSEKDTFEPWIRFYIKPFQNMVLIHSENNYEGKLSINPNFGFFSTKQEPHHGLGLKRIRDIVSENNGFFQYSTDNNIFTIHIIIPLKEESVIEP